MAAPIARMCAFCDAGGIAKYTCPRCNAPFCSTSCYACRRHANCSEDFYRDWVKTHVESSENRDHAKRQIMQILERLKQEEECRDDDNTDDFAPDIGDRFADINLESDNLDTDIIWSRLTEKEKSQFKSLLDSGHLETFLPVWEPWWTREETVKLIHELSNENESPEINDCRPMSPSMIPTLKTLTRTVPSFKLKYNIASVLYAYAVVTRFYNGDHNDFATGSVEAIVGTSECLSKNVTFNDMEQAVIAATRQNSLGNMEMSHSLALKAMDDVRDLVNSKPYALSALTDLQRLVKKSRTSLKKDDRHGITTQLKRIEKKLDYYISWTNEYHSELIAIVLELELVKASLATNWARFDEDHHRTKQELSKPPAKPKIEEIN